MRPGANVVRVPLGRRWECSLAPDGGEAAGRGATPIGELVSDQSINSNYRNLALASARPNPIPDRVSLCAT